MFKILSIFLLFSSCISLYADEEKKDLSKECACQEKTGNKEETENEEEGPPPIGNFSLPASQQPAALFGFGGNMIDKGEVQLYLFVDEFAGRKNRLNMDIIPGILFGITDQCSLYFNAPFTPIMRDGCHRSSGLEDFFIQMEYAFYNKKTPCYFDQATLVANITFPTGSVRKNPITGFGAPGFFLGGTFYRTFVDWFFFTSHGATLTTSDHRTKIGNQFLYEFGFGRNIPSPEGWIYAWMVELDGQYYQKNRINGRYDKNSGGNTLFVTPSIWLSSREMLLQVGATLPIAQNLFGRQHRLDYSLIAQFAWSFY